MKLILDSGKEFKFENEFKFILINDIRIYEESTIPYTEEEVNDFEDIYNVELEQKVKEVI